MTKLLVWEKIPTANIISSLLTYLRNNVFLQKKINPNKYVFIVCYSPRQSIFRKNQYHMLLFVESVFSKAVIKIKLSAN